MIDQLPPDLPVRSISRLATEMHVAGMLLVDTALPGEFDRSIVALVLMRVCAPDWTIDGALRRPERLTRFSSANAIATSLCRSPETIRRHANALIAAGICVRTRAGLALTPDGADGFDPLRLYAAYHDLMIAFVQDVAALVPLPAIAHSTERPLLAAVIDTALDIALIPIEQYGGILPDWTAARVWAFIGALNVRHVTRDPVLSRRYAIASTPDSVRRPVSPRMIERAFGMPYATVWRHCHALGLLSQTEEGWLIRTAQLRDGPVEDSVIAAVVYYLRRIVTLVGQGLDPANLSAACLDPRPPLPPAPPPVP